MDEKDIISWTDDYFLTWDDFKAEPNPSVYQDSFSKLNYHPTWTVNSEMLDGEIFYFIESVQLTTHFLKHLSWIREQHATLQLLKHEQGHFDLAESLKGEIINDLQKNLKGKQFPTRGQNDEQRKQFAKEDSGILISKELDSWKIKLQELRDKYDEETEFGTNLEKQNSYNKVFETLRK